METHWGSSRNFQATAFQRASWSVTWIETPQEGFVDHPPLLQRRRGAGDLLWTHARRLDVGRTGKGVPTAGWEDTAEPSLDI